MRDAAWLWPFLVLSAGAAVTYAWRALGVLLAGRIDAGGAAFRWAACVAYALLAGLVARMIVLPIGPLGDAPLEARLGGAAVGLAAFLLTGRNLLAGVAAGVAALVALAAA
jgi:branched-subunit amino acid transport protein